MGEQATGEEVEAATFTAADLFEQSPFPESVLEKLREPLDEARIRTREGRGTDKFSYLATHDVIRTANRIFGFGGWGYRIIEQEPIGEQEVTKNNRKGTHVAYRCRVELSVAGGPVVSGSGYGDATEYTEARRNTAHELALKESESDALKRALRCYGDQFGLRLYANDEERARYDAEEDPKAAFRARLERPKGWADLAAFWQEQAACELKPWAAAILEAAYGGRGLGALSNEEAQAFGSKLTEVALDIAVEGPGAAGFPPIPDEKIVAFIAAHFGVVVAPPAAPQAELPAAEEGTLDAEAAKD